MHGLFAEYMSTTYPYSGFPLVEGFSQNVIHPYLLRPVCPEMHSVRGDYLNFTRHSLIQHFQRQHRLFVSMAELFFHVSYPRRKPGASRPDSVTFMPSRTTPSKPERYAGAQPYGEGKPLTPCIAAILAA